MIFNNIKGMRRKSGGRKSSAGTGNAVLKTGLRPGGKDEKEIHQKESSSGISPLGSRMTEESEAYYNNQNVSDSFNRLIIVQNKF
jgi:hypothetical protein